MSWRHEDMPFSAEGVVPAIPCLLRIEDCGPEELTETLDAFGYHVIADLNPFVNIYKYQVQIP